MTNYEDEQFCRRLQTESRPEVKQIARGALGDLHTLDVPEAIDLFVRALA
jgi:hypothetical protein